MANTQPQPQGNKPGPLAQIASDFTTKAWVLIPIGIGINVVGGVLVKVLNLPLFLDTIGTILTALLAGPWVGALGGALTNIILGLVQSPTSIPYALTNIAIGLVVGYMAYAGWFKAYWKMVVTGIVVMLTAIIVSAPITTYVFGGVSGTGGESVLTAYFLATGSQIMSSVLKASFVVEPIDKIVSVFIAFFIARAVPDRYRPQAARKTLP